MKTSIRCRKCGKTFGGDVVDDRFGGVCPRCLALFALDDESDLVPSPGAPTGIEPQQIPLKPGASFRGLEILEVLGRGGMGVVYKARQTDLGRTVALKMLSPRLASDPEFSRRFNREARTMASLNHPNLVQVYEFGRESDLYFLIMEYVDGVSLREMIVEGSLRPQDALRLVPQICEALEYAHAEGVVHRDIKPENILVDRRGRVKIADFGLAKMAERSGPTLTQTNVVMGTPHYMAPEQYESARGVDHRADIYSLGVVLYEMLTGELPVGSFDPPSERSGIDERVDEVVRKALAKRPERRYQKVREMHTDVEEIRSGRAGSAPARPVRRSDRKGMAVWAGVFVLWLVLGALLTFAPISSPLLLGWGAAGGILVLAALIAILARIGRSPAEPESPPERLSVMAILSLIFFFVAVVLAIVGAAGEGSRIHWLSVIGFGTSGAFFLAAITLAFAARTAIHGSRGRLGGRGFSTATLMLALGAFSILLILVILIIPFREIRMRDEVKMVEEKRRQAEETFRREYYRLENFALSEAELPAETMYQERGATENPLLTRDRMEIEKWTGRLADEMSADLRLEPDLITGIWLGFLDPDDTIIAILELDESVDAPLLESRLRDALVRSEASKNMTLFRKRRFVAFIQQKRLSEGGRDAFVALSHALQAKFER